MPAVDDDGNDVAGIRGVELRVPLATLTGWNPRHPEQGAPGDLMSMLGSTLAGESASLKSNSTEVVVLTPLATSYIWAYIFQYTGPLNGLLSALGLSSLEQTWLASPTWALWTILVVLVWQNAGLSMVIYLAGLQAIPAELDEAAAVDGASAWYRFRRVTLPMLLPDMPLSNTPEDYRAYHSFQLSRFDGKGWAKVETVKTD